MLGVVWQGKKSETSASCELPKYMPGVAEVGIGAAGCNNPGGGEGSRSRW